MNRSIHILRIAVVAVMGWAFSLDVLATEAEDARAACERVEALRIHEQGPKAPPPMCEYNTRSPAFWHCIEEKMKAGNPWLYSTEQCKNA